MRVLMCGDREWASVEVVYNIFKAHNFPEDTIIVHGDARGADRIAGDVATVFGYKVEAHPANWKSFGRAAGPIRNQEMLDSGIDLVIAFHNSIETSRGTADTLKRARKAGLQIMLVKEAK